MINGKNKIVFVDKVWASLLSIIVNTKSAMVINQITTAIKILLMKKELIKLYLLLVKI